MGLLLVVDIILRSRNFWYYYTDRGVVPYTVVSSTGYRVTVSFPIWELNSHYVVVAALFAVSFIVGVC